MAVFFLFKSKSGNADGQKREKEKMKKNKSQNDEAEVIETEEIDTEPTTEAADETETNAEEVETETETVTEQETEPEEEQEEDESEDEPEDEPEPEPEPEKKKTVKEKKKEEDADIDAELDKFFADLKKKKEKQKAKEAEKKAEKSEKMFTQAEFEKALKSTLAKKLPPKDEMEQFKKWRESQQTIEEKMTVLSARNNKLEDEIESLKHENLIIKSGVDKEAIDFVQFNVEKMEGDFEENLEEYLKSHKQYLKPAPVVVQKTTVVEGAKHEKTAKTAITKKELDEMGYQERAKYREEHPEEYAKAMGR